jgi:hypothetical protein
MLALLPLILSVAPQLASLLFGPKGGDVAARVSGIVTDVTGAAPSAGDAGAASAAALQADPQKMAALTQKLSDLQVEMQKEADRESDQARADFLSQMRLSNDDTASARAMATSGKGPMAWGAPVISILVMLLFAAKELGLDQVIAHAIGATPPSDSGSELLYAAVTLTLGFWLGSSNGSQMKNAHIEQLTNSLKNTVPVATAEKMLAAPAA